MISSQGADRHRSGVHGKSGSASKSELNDEKNSAKVTAVDGSGCMTGRERPLARRILWLGRSLDETILKSVSCPSLNRLPCSMCNQSCHRICKFLFQNVCVVSEIYLSFEKY
jgi:hypothetical protein